MRNPVSIAGIRCSEVISSNITLDQQYPYGMAGIGLHLVKPIRRNNHHSKRYYIRKLSQQVAGRSWKSIGVPILPIFSYGKALCASHCAPNEDHLLLKHEQFLLEAFGNCIGESFCLNLLLSTQEYEY